MQTDSTHSDFETDVVIFGGGMVGAAVALGFLQKGYQVSVVEPHVPGDFSVSTPVDMRVSAISLGSERFLRELGAWQFLIPERLQPYEKLSVWEQKNCETVFSAEDINLTHLGHLIENRHLQWAIHQAIARYSTKCQWFSRGELVDAHRGLCQLEETSVKAKLVVAADGGNSAIRQQAGIGTTGWGYSQQVVAIAIETELPSVAHTFQQFTPTGPMAYLPLFGHNASLVWYADPQTRASLLSASDAELKDLILANFPALHSDFCVKSTASFPITRCHANQYYSGRLALCGDAAHTINPLAGQGVNIGFKDVQALLACQPEQLISEQLTTEQLRIYEDNRRTDNLQMMTAMDGFNLVFSNNNPILKPLRNLGLFVAQRSGPLKDWALKHALGIS